MDYPSIDIAETGRRIRLLIQSKGYTLKNLASDLGLSSPQAIYKWLWGKSLPSVDNLFALSILLDTSLDDVLIGKENVHTRRYDVRSIAPKASGETISYHFVNFKAA